MGDVFGGVFGDVFGDVFGSDAEADVTPPELLSATISGGGTTLTLRFDEPVTTAVSTGTTLTASGGAVTVTYVSGSGTAFIVYSLNRPVLSNETVTLDHVSASSDIADLADNELADIADFAVTLGGVMGRVQPRVSPRVFPRVIAARAAS